MFKKLLAFLPLIFALGIFSFALYYVRTNNLNKVAGVSTISREKTVKGIILPHHDLAQEYISASLERISQYQNFSHIVIIGPNHFQPNSTQFISTNQLFDYSVSDKYANQLEETVNVSLNKEISENEHSITVPIHYLHTRFPNASFLPIIAPAYFNIIDISQISVILSQSLPDDTLFVASVDFAHEKMLLEALEKNKETESAIANFDYKKLYQFKDDHLDSPASIGLLLNIMQRLGSNKWELWYNSHGAFIEDKYNLQGTSYLIGVFSE